MSMEEGGPERQSDALESMEGEQLRHEADHERLVKETEEIHAEEAAERGEVPPAKAPWWMFWKR